MTGLKRTLRSRRGFTLVELIVVLVILGITASIGVPALTGYVDNAKEKQAVSETQACVETATRIGAQKYALVQSAVMTGDTGSDNANALTKWAGTLDTKAPPVSGGTVALTEGSGQYLLNVSDPPSGGIATIDDLAGIAGVSGHVSTMTCNANGQVLYLVYTSADGIQVVYTATGTTASVDGSDDTIVVPKPDDGKTDPEPDKPDVPTVKKLDVTFKIVDANTGENVIGATMKVIKGTDFTEEWTTTEASPTHVLPLPVGTNYLYQEFTSPDGYEMGSNISFNVYADADGNLHVSGDNNVTVTATSATVTMKVKKKAVSEKTMNVTFIKKDSYTDKQLAGARLQIVNAATNAVVYEWTSEKDKSQQWSLPAGSYRYEEVSAPAHYTIAEPIPFTIAQNENKLELSCDVTGAQTDKSKLTMVDKVETTTVVFWASDENRNNLSGIPLKLTGGLLSTRPESDSEWISDKDNGHKLEIPLVPGTYTFTVNDKQKDFNYDNFSYDTQMWITFDVDDAGNVTIGSKSSQNGEGYIVTGGTDMGLHLICKAKTFRLRDLTFYKVDSDNNPLAGATFEITDTTKNGTNALVGTVTSGKDKNKTITSNLSDAVVVSYNRVYRLHETNAPDGYELASDVYFKIQYEDKKTVLYSSNSMNGPFTLTSGNYITVVDEKKNTDGELILTGSDVKVTINGAKPWPAKDTELKPGDVYYVDKDGKREYYMTAYTGDNPKVSGPPDNDTWAAVPAVDGYTRVWTDSTIEVDNSGKNSFVDLHRGDLYVHNGKLYLYINSYSANMDPPWVSMASWVIIDSPYEVKIERKHATVNINLVDSILKNNISGCWLKLETQNGKRLQVWKSSDKPRVFDLSPGTYTVKSKDGYPLTGYDGTIDYTFTVREEDDNQTVNIKIPYKMITYQIKITANDKSRGTPLAGAQIEIEGVCASGKTYKTTVTTDENGQATLDIPASKTNCKYQFTPLPKGNLTCSSDEQEINQWSRNNFNFNYSGS
ncbi:SpaA isopeptide-forming pilin-related protein [Gemmiger sp.]